MRYILLIYTNEVEDQLATPEQQQETYDAYNAFGQEAHDAIRGGEALMATTSATTVRVPTGRKRRTGGGSWLCTMSCWRCSLRRWSR